MAADNGDRPAASVSLFCVRLDRGHTTCLHFAAWVDLFARASVLLAWLRQRHQARRTGSLFVRAPSSGRHAPCRGSGRRASPRSTSAAMASPTASAAPRRLAFRSLPFHVVASSPGVRRCACRPAVACGKRLPSRPSATVSARVAVFGRGCRCAGLLSLASIRCPLTSALVGLCRTHTIAVWRI